jgi:hypothetical protein
LNNRGFLGAQSKPLSRAGKGKGLRERENRASDEGVCPFPSKIPAITIAKDYTYLEYMAKKC